MISKAMRDLQASLPMQVYIAKVQALQEIHGLPATAALSPDLKVLRVPDVASAPVGTPRMPAQALK
ncbi:MAG: hypothetical protein KGL39_11585 [Patescibacteria group bacterium]|nr:hypothetical protein [Patescibacteria group bacterium]